MAKLKQVVQRRKLAATLAILCVLILVAANCGGGGGESRPVEGPGDPVIPIVPADDHGDTRPDATALVPGSSAEGQIEAVDDDDYFRLQVTEAGTLTVYTTGDLDTHGELQAGDGNVLASDEDSGDGTNFRIVHDVGAGTYYVRVNSQDMATGSYVVLARFATKDLPPDHSDTPGGAAPIVAGQSVEGSLASPDDVDYFRLELNEPGTISVTIDAEPGVEIALLDADSNVLITEVTSSSATITAAVNKGSYFTRIRKAAGKKLSESGKYLLKNVTTNVESVINIIRGIPDVELQVGAASLRIDLTNHFSTGLINVPLTYRITLSVAGIVSFTLERSALTISSAHGATPGSVNVRVTATDAENNVAVDVFKATLKDAPNQPPKTNSAFPQEVTLTPGEPYRLPLKNFFEDETPDKLTYTLAIEDERGEGWGVEIVGGKILAVSSQAGMKDGDIVIFTVTATDPEGLSAKQRFIIEIEDLGLFGAIGVDLISDQVRNRCSVHGGIAVNFFDVSSARTAAKDICVADGGVRSDCRAYPFGSGEGQNFRCGAVAYGTSMRGDGSLSRCSVSPGWGSTISAAEQSALSSCREITSNCVIATLGGSRASACTSS